MKKIIFVIIILNLFVLTFSDNWQYNDSEVNTGIYSSLKFRDSFYPNENFGYEFGFIPRQAISGAGDYVLINRPGEYKDELLGAIEIIYPGTYNVNEGYVNQLMAKVYAYNDYYWGFSYSSSEEGTLKNAFKKFVVDKPPRGSDLSYYDIEKLYPLFYRDYTYMSNSYKYGKLEEIRDQIYDVAGKSAYDKINISISLDKEYEPQTNVSSIVKNLNVYIKDINKYGDWSGYWEQYYINNVSKSNFDYYDSYYYWYSNKFRGRNVFTVYGDLYVPSNIEPGEKYIVLDITFQPSTCVCP